RKFSKRRSDKQNPSPPPAAAPFFSSLSRKLSRSQSQAEVPAFATHSRSRSQAQPSKLAEALSNQSLCTNPLSTLEPTKATTLASFAAGPFFHHARTQSSTRRHQEPPAPFVVDQFGILQQQPLHSRSEPASTASSFRSKSRSGAHRPNPERLATTDFGLLPRSESPERLELNFSTSSSPFGSLSRQFSRTRHAPPLSPTPQSPASPTAATPFTALKRSLSRSRTQRDEDYPTSPVASTSRRGRFSRPPSPTSPTPPTTYRQPLSPSTSKSPFGSLRRKLSVSQQKPPELPPVISAPFTVLQADDFLPPSEAPASPRTALQRSFAAAHSPLRKASPPPTPPPDPEPEEDFVVVSQDGPEEPPTPISATAFGTLRRSLSRSSWKSYSRPPSPQQDTPSAFTSLKRSLSRSSSRSRAPTPDLFREDSGLPARPPSPATLQRTLTNSISPLIALVGDSSRRIRRTTTRRADLRAQAAAATNGAGDVYTEPPTPSEPLSEVNINKQLQTLEELPAVQLSPPLKFFPELLTTDEPEDLEEETLQYEKP
ncbi:hypothetical protein M407DRAFT_35050, partial [Tulasnella calospora MUT 4182]